MAGNTKLNMAFVANLFNNYPGLPPMDAEEGGDELEELREETREEKSKFGFFPTVILTLPLR